MTTSTQPPKQESKTTHTPEKNSSQSFSISSRYAILAAVVLLAGLPLVVNLALQRQESRTRAAEIVTLNPTADTYVKSSSAGTNYGTATTMYADGDPKKISYLKFDLTSLAGKTVLSAKLRFKVADDSAKTPQTVVEVSDTSWNERSMTYANRPSFGGTLATFNANGGTKRLIEVDVTAYIAARAGSSAAFGIDSAGDGLNFYTRETVDKPALVVQTQTASLTPAAAPTSTPILEFPTAVPTVVVPTSVLTPVPSAFSSPSPTQSEPTPTPASTQEALLNGRVGFGTNVTGGLTGTKCIVTSLSDSGSGTLRGCLASGNRWITFGTSGTIKLSNTIKVLANTTIDGRGANVNIIGAELLIKTPNVIITNLKFTASGPSDAAPDAVRMSTGANGVWVDHNTFIGGGDGVGDGAIDMTDGATNITVSWNKFVNWDKSMLINGEGPDDSAMYKPQVTLHHNFIDSTRQRNPKLRHGMLHAYNNFLRNWRSYGMGIEDNGQLNSQSNIFEAGSNNRAIRTDPINGGLAGFARSTGDLLLGGAVVVVRSPEQVFTPAYPYIVEPANDALKQKLMTQTGWQAQ